ncbi:ABC transporter ATP-binding protein [Bacillus gobiensis]|uniref:ABC transporter ATP-binding protein n=1 Tax=Bacillus gobiensis TaxID=1441095 RepID=UPI003D225854
MIRFENVSKLYGGETKAVNELNLQIDAGEFFVLIGPSGCGKTTSLKMINRLVDLSEGTISINGKKISDYDIHELRWNIGYVLQQIALFPHLTIEENISIVPELKKWSKRKISDRVEELMHMVGLDPDKYRHRKPSELSGGQQQRVGVVRALAADPEILLMDEPFSALDPINREKLQKDIADLQRKIKKTILFVTHDIQEALELGDRLAIMNEGELVQSGTPEEIINHPVNDFVRNFVGLRVSKHQFLDQLTAESLLDHTGDEVADPLPTVFSNASLEEVIPLLAAEPRAAVMKNGEVIGTITRKSVFQYIANRTVRERERG